jgi:hypothetical protein
LHKDICFCEHFQDEVPVLCILDIETNRFLAAIQPYEIRALPLNGVVVAAREIADRTFNLNDAGPRVGEESGAEWRRNGLLKRYDQQAIKWLRH